MPLRIWETEGTIILWSGVVLKVRVTLENKQESDCHLPCVLSQYICTYQHKFVRKGLKQKVTFFFSSYNWQ